MSIDYFHTTQEMSMTCDTKDCIEFAEFLGNWQECIDQAKDESWRITKNEDTGEYEHYCPTCWRNQRAEGVFDG